MAIGSEGSGRCAGEIDVLVEVKNRGAWLCCGLNCLGFILVGKAPQDWLLRWRIVPGIGGGFDAFGLTEEIKSPCGGRGAGD